MRKGQTRMIIRTASLAAPTGWLEVGWQRMRCALGRSGTRWQKREGDGATPAGVWEIGRVLWRADRGRRPSTMAQTQSIRPEDGWCDAPSDRNYNRQVRHPYPASAERLWRDDGLYDVLVVLDHNQRPRMRGGGSAIFLHVARPGFAPTEGCVALAEVDLRRLLERVSRQAHIVIGRRDMPLNRRQGGGASRSRDI